MGSTGGFCLGVRRQGATVVRAGGVERVAARSLASLFDGLIVERPQVEDLVEQVRAYLGFVMSGEEW